MPSTTAGACAKRNESGYEVLRSGALGTRLGRLSLGAGCLVKCCATERSAERPHGPQEEEARISAITGGTAGGGRLRAALGSRSRAAAAIAVRSAVGLDDPAVLSRDGETWILPSS